jgi:hypothetical protein
MMHLPTKRYVVFFLAVCGLVVIALAQSRAPNEGKGRRAQMSPEFQKRYDWLRKMSIQAKSPIPASFWTGEVEWGQLRGPRSWRFAQKDWSLTVIESDMRRMIWMREIPARAPLKTRRTDAYMEAQIHATYARLGLQRGRDYTVSRRNPTYPNGAPAGLNVTTNLKRKPDQVPLGMVAMYDLRCDCIATFQAYLPDDRRRPQAQPRRQDPP